MAEIFKVVSSKIQAYQAEKVGLEYSSALQKIQDAPSNTSLPTSQQLDGVFSAARTFQSAEQNAAGLPIDQNTKVLRDLVREKLKTELKKRLLDVANSPDSMATMQLAKKAAEHGVSAQLRDAATELLAAGKIGPVQKTSEMSPAARNLTELNAVYQACLSNGSATVDAQHDAEFDTRVREALQPENLKKTAERLDYQTSIQDYAIQCHRDRMSNDDVFASEATAVIPTDVAQDKKTGTVFVGAAEPTKNETRKPAQLR